MADVRFTADTDEVNKLFTETLKTFDIQNFSKANTVRERFR